MRCVIRNSKLLFYICVIGVICGSLSPVLAFPIRRDTLPNGLAILTTEDHHLPVVVLRLSARVGSVDDPRGQEGLAALTGGLLSMGTRTRSAEDINHAIDFIGGQIWSSSDEDHTMIQVKVLTKDLDLALDLLSDIARNPAFRDSELTRARKQTIARIRRSADEPSTVLRQAFDRLVYGTHHYAHPDIGYDSAVAGLGRAAVVSFYNTWFAPNNCYVCAVGDFSTDSLNAKIAARFGNWPRRPAPARNFPDPAPVQKTVGRVIKRPEMNQARVVLGNPGPREGAPDIDACRLMNFTLGGSVFSSKIGTAIRGERGLAYDARSGFDARLFGGDFSASTQTRTESTLTAVKLLLEQMKSIREKGVAAAELQKAKDYYLGSFPLQYESAESKLSALDRIELFHLGLGYVDQTPARVKAVTQAEVLRAARDHVFPDKYVLVVVGNLTEKDLALPGIEWVKN